MKEHLAQEIPLSYMRSRGIVNPEHAKKIENQKRFSDFCLNTNYHLGDMDSFVFAFNFYINAKCAFTSLYYTIFE